MAIITTFTIVKGDPKEFNIIIKAVGSVAPQQLDLTDTFTYTLMDHKQQVKYLEDIPMTVLDAANGRVRGVITAEQSLLLPSKKGAREDYFITRPSLMLVVSGNTVSQGLLTTFINNVYVVDK